jgi:hypothetical protein
MSESHTPSAPGDAGPEDNIRWGLVYTAVLIFAALVIGLLGWFSSIFTPSTLR